MLYHGIKVNHPLRSDVKPHFQAMLFERLSLNYPWPECFSRKIHPIPPKTRVGCGTKQPPAESRWV